MSMATKKKTTNDNEIGGGDTIKETKKVAGEDPGTIAAKAGIAKVTDKGSGKFVKKDKKRLPRKEKKRLSKRTPI